MARRIPTPEEVDAIYEDLIKNRPKTRLEMMAEDGTLEGFLKELNAYNGDDNKKRLQHGMKPITLEERVEGLKMLHLRKDQMLPEGDWRCWLLDVGRGGGKTYTCSTNINHFCYSNPGAIVGLFGMNITEAQQTMVEGVSGILSTCKPWDPPKWKPSKGRGYLEWSNGSRGFVYGTKFPNKMRGPEFDLSWCDEFQFWEHPMKGYVKVDQMTRSSRIGRSRVIISTTPENSPALDYISALPTTIETHGASYYNKFLEETYMKSQIYMFWGTTMWDQEVEGIRLDRHEDALWTHDLIDETRKEVSREDLKRVIISVDPAMKSKKEVRDHNTHGIIVLGLGYDDHIYILEDLSTDGDPVKVAEIVQDAFDFWEASEVIYEDNQGGKWVEQFLTRDRPDIPIHEVTAKESKLMRAAPAYGLYRSGFVHHTKKFAKLESQMCTYVDGMKSPDRLDANVHGIIYLKPSKKRRRIIARAV